MKIHHVFIFFHKTPGRKSNFGAPLHYRAVKSLEWNSDVQLNTWRIIKGTEIEGKDVGLRILGLALIQTNV